MFNGRADRQIADPGRLLSGDGQAYFHEPTGDKRRTIQAPYVGISCACGAYTQPREGKRDAYSYGKYCHPGVIARSAAGDAASTPLRRPRSADAARLAIGHRVHFCAQSPGIRGEIQGS